MSVMQGTITEEDTKFVETWENVSQQQNYIIRLDVRGDDKPEQIAGPRQFFITTQERLITQERVLDVRNDPFLNGCFRPIKVPPTVNVDTNPNALSDADIANVYKASEFAWDEYMANIDSPATLRRFLEIAEAMLDRDEDVSAKRLRQVSNKLREVEPQVRVTQKDRSEYEKLANAPAAAVANTPGKRPASRS